MVEANQEEISLVEGPFIEFLECMGSVRLVNAVKRSLDENRFPYSAFNELLADEPEYQIEKLKKIPDLGNKSAHEYCDLIERFISSEGDPFRLGSALSSGSEIEHSDTEDEDFSLVEGPFLKFLNCMGSVRLVNAVKLSLEENSFPYSAFGEFLVDKPEYQIEKLKKLPNLGKKSAHEYCDLIARFMSPEGNHFRLDTAQCEERNVERSYIAETMAEYEVAQPGRFEPEELLSGLKERERYVLECRFGIGVAERMTLEMLGQELSVTRERIRQIESKALRHLRAYTVQWKVYLDDHKAQVAEQLFGTSLALKEVRDIYGVLGLAISVVDKKQQKYLRRIATRFQGYWIHPKLDFDAVKSAYTILLEEVKDTGSSRLPLPVSEIAFHKKLDVQSVLAAVEVLHRHSIYKEYLIEGGPTARKRRTVNLLTIYGLRKIPSPCDLWNIKAEYWKAFPEDKCSGRDLMLCLEKHPHHFINLRELGWMRLCESSAYNQTVSEGADEISSKQGIPQELYKEPVKDSNGLANSVYRMFQQYGPMQLAVAADRFREYCPEYAASSIYPMLVVYAVFVRLAPGIMGIQSHRLEQQWVQQARAAMLNAKQIDLYVLAQRSAPPMIAYPLWDSEMEHQWCKWLFEHHDSQRLGQLLSCIDLDRWDVDPTEREWWGRRKERSAISITEPAIRRWEIRFIESIYLVTALAAASISGTTNWMHINQALGWRIETTRVALIMAILVHLGALRPTGRWFESHLLTDRGRELFETLLRLREDGSGAECMLNSVELQRALPENLGWASIYSFEQLLEKVVDTRSDESSPNVPSENETGDELDLDSFYSALSKKQLVDLIGDDTIGEIDDD